LFQTIGNAPANDEVDFHDGFDMQRIEEGLAGDRVPDGLDVDVELRPEQRREPFGIADLELDDEIDVAGEAGLGVVACRDGARDHVRQTGRVETRGYELEDGELIEHASGYAKPRALPIDQTALAGLKFTL